MSRKEFMDKFFDLCKDAQEEIPPNVIAEILRDYADRLDQMKKLFLLGLCLLEQNDFGFLQQKRVDLHVCRLEKNQFDLHYVPFEELVDPENLVTVVRYIKTDSDFHKLARYLEQDID